MLQEYHGKHSYGLFEFVYQDCLVWKKVAQKSSQICTCAISYIKKVVEIEE